MMTRFTAAVLALLVAGGTRGGDAPFRTETHPFKQWQWTMQVPAAYDTMTSASPNDRMTMFGFASAAREDGTHAMVQVSLIDITGLPGAADSLPRFAEQMIAGVARNREQFQKTASTTEIDGWKAIRYAWSGIGRIPDQTGRLGQPVALRGVMLVGISGNVAIALHTQDLEAHAAQTLKVGEESLRTFTVGVRRP